MPAALVSLGTVIGNVVPTKLMRMGPGTAPNMKALAAIGTGLAIQMLGAQFLGKTNATNLALGAVASGVSVFIQRVLPQDFRISGLGQGTELVSEEAINDEIRQIAVAGLGQNEEFALTTVAGTSPESEVFGLDEDIEAIDLETPSTMASY